MIKIRVPATTANLGTGFDAIGVALTLYLQVEMDFHSCNQIEIVEANQKINLEIEDNLVYQGALRVFREAKLDVPPLKIRIINNIPRGKGLGSSAAALTAGMWAANALIDHKFSENELINWAVEIEGHPDNIVPAVVGGCAAAMVEREEIRYQKISTLPGLTFTVAVPDFMLPTEKSRKALPEKISLSDMTDNLQRACFLVAALANLDYKSLGTAMEDKIFKPVRKQFIPGIEAVISSAVDAGAINAVISGAGPSIVALSERNQKNIGKCMQDAFKKYKIPSRVYHLKVDCNGIKFLK